MNKLASSIFNFFKKETIFSISLILAIVSCFFIHPNLNYLNYINWETIFLLFIIMLFVEILKNLSVFEIIVSKLLRKITNIRQLIFLLVFSCFFSSIFITNDVSLIIFVPFTILALNYLKGIKKIKKINLVIFIVSLETIAANVGCMILPIGAPHNIVLYTTYHISFVSFFNVLLPYIIVSVIFLVILLLFVPNKEINISKINSSINNKFNKENFFKKVFLSVDYYLILTFIVLFILIGNLENIEFFKILFNKWISGNEVLFGVISSQFISNVPSAILLSSFSTNYKSIIIGVNIGSFGSLIASMANLISYRIFVKEFDNSKSNFQSNSKFNYKYVSKFNSNININLKLKYLKVFSILNLVLLIILLIVYLI